MAHEPIHKLTVRWQLRNEMAVDIVGISDSHRDGIADGAICELTAVNNNSDRKISRYVEVQEIGKGDYDIRDYLKDHPSEPKDIKDYEDSVFMNLKTRGKFHLTELKTYQFRIRQARLWGKLVYFIKYPSRHQNLAVILGVVALVLGVLGWTVKDLLSELFRPPPVEQTFYAFYGDLDKSGKTTFKDETVVLTQSGQSSTVYGKATSQRGASWLLDGHRVGDHLVLTEIRERNKNDPFPTAAATYYLQTFGSSYSGTVTYWDRCLVSVVECPIILNPTNMDVDSARKQSPNLFSRQCTKLDLVPDSKEPPAQTARPSCPNPTPN